jgi:Na+-transporting NADH:ubiquinone oxidoreductase subunit A
MAHFKLKKGLHLPLAGLPHNTLHQAPAVSRVALLGRDYVGLKARLLVSEGEVVKQGQALLADKAYPDILFPSPAGGVVEAIRRGERRALLAVVIRVAEKEEIQRFEAFTTQGIDGLSQEAVKFRMLESGAWTALRRRPFAKIPSPAEVPSALFVTAHDTQPLAAEMGSVLAPQDKYLEPGLRVLRRLFSGPIHFCTDEKWSRKLPDLADFHHTRFSGPHPAGNAGTHIHFLHTAEKNRPVWHIDLADLLDLGHLFLEGTLPVDRVAALGGPGVKAPRLLMTRQGADLSELLDGELLSGAWRVISGSVLAGRNAAGEEAFLGRYHHQITVIGEDLSRSFLGWTNPFPRHLFSLKRVVLGAWLPRRLRAMTTSRNGGVRALVPTGSFEKVMPLDLLPTHLLKALLCGDVEAAEALGCLELAEEDLALCTYVCPSKIEYGPVLREMLDLIEKEG